MKKVVHYKAGPFVPVTENWMSSQIARLERYRPVVYCDSLKNPELFGGTKVRSLRLKSKRYPWTAFNRRFYDRFAFYPFFYLSLKLDRPDLVHAQFGPAGYKFLRLKRMFGLPMVTSFYGYDISMLPNLFPECRPLYAELFVEGELFLAEGPHMAARLADLGCPEEKILVHRLGIDLERIHYVPRRPDEGGEVRILISAGFREKKGLPLAVEAFGRVLRDRPGLDMRLTIIGDSLGYPEMETEKRRILEKVAEFGLDDRVDFMGFQPPHVFLEQLYRHHIFLSPSLTASNGDTEGGAPISIIEATASGMPVLSTHHCDIPEVVPDGESGFLAPEGDVDALAERLEALVLDPTRWEAMGRRGRAHVEERFDLRMQVERLEGIYDSILRNESLNTGGNHR